MDHDGPVQDTLVAASELEVEAFGKLEVELDGGALEGSSEGIADGDVNLGAVEGTVTGVELPLARVLLLERVLQLLYDSVRLSGQEG